MIKPLRPKYGFCGRWAGGPFRPTTEVHKTCIRAIKINHIQVFLAIKLCEIMKNYRHFITISTKSKSDNGVFCVRSALRAMPLFGKPVWGMIRKLTAWFWNAFSP